MEIQKQTDLELEYVVIRSSGIWQAFSAPCLPLTIPCGTFYCLIKERPVEIGDKCSCFHIFMYALCHF